MSDADPSCPSCRAPLAAGQPFCSKCGAPVVRPNADALQRRVQALLADEFVVERELGRGGMAAVFAAWDPALERRFGDKVPVLMHGERELCHYHLDVSAVTDYLRDFR